MKLATVGSKSSNTHHELDLGAAENVVEVGILLPVNQAADLIQMAKSRQESVGHMIRKLIDRELATTR